jgi:hypothetical protein
MQAVSPTRSRPSTSQVRPVCTLVHLLVHLRPLGEALARWAGCPAPGCRDACASAAPPALEAAGAATDGSAAACRGPCSRQLARRTPWHPRAKSRARYAASQPPLHLRVHAQISLLHGPCLAMNTSRRTSVRPLMIRTEAAAEIPLRFFYSCHLRFWSEPGRCPCARALSCPWVGAAAPVSCVARRRRPTSPLAAAS